MAKIRILPEILANKIAAGEVVERPASVVKELVENSIDAGADRIIVSVEQGGRRLIRVSDNGCGMSRDDALLAIERFATSKIASDNDLGAISTLGFRGEALPSIASVSRFTLVSREKGSDTACLINISGGKITDVKETGAPEGTMVEVRDLFFNTPARRKFMRTVPTELGHITELLAKIALCYPGISFLLEHNGQILRDWPACNPADRTADVLGSGFRSNMIPISLEKGIVSVSGWISKPGSYQKSARRIYVFVNGRPVRDRGIMAALTDGYRGRIMKQAWPAAVLNIRLPADTVDVNVHPTKNEIRFAAPSTVYSAVRDAVSAALVDSVNQPAHEASFSESAGNTDTPERIPRNREMEFPDPMFRPPAKARAVHHDTLNESLPPFEPAAPPAPAQEPRPEPVRGPACDPGFTDLGNARPIGQFNRTYLLCELYQTLVIIDQHAAHERIVFERLESALKGNKLPVQELVTAETIEVNYREAAVIEAMLPGLLAMGFEIEPFGPGIFAIKAVPDILAGRSAGELILNIAAKIIENGYAPGAEAAMEASIAVLACHGAIRANQPLSETEIRALLKQLAACRNPQTCPHGRPTAIFIPAGKLEKDFKRTGA